VLVGGLAATVHGSALVTRDVDICAVLTPHNVQRLREILGELHPWHRFHGQHLSFMAVPIAGTDVKNLYLQTDLGALDILSEIKGIGDFAAVRKRATSITLFGRTCWVIHIDDLIRAKEAVGREKDLLAVKELKAIRSQQKAVGDEPTA
jgi:hypothetical protein